MKPFVKEIIKHGIGCCVEAFASAAGGHIAERIFAKPEDDKPAVKDDSKVTEK